MARLAGIFFLLVFLAFGCSAVANKRSFGQAIDDNVIALKLRTSFIKDKLIEADNIHIQVWRGVVMLSGVIETQEEINRAIEIAEQQQGVNEVKAYLVLKDLSVSTQPRIKKVIWPFFSKKREKAGSSRNLLNETDLMEDSSVLDPESHPVVPQDKNTETGDSSFH